MPPRYEEYVKDIHSSASHLLSLVNDLLGSDQSLETGRRELREELVSIDQNSIGRDLTKIVGNWPIVARDLTITSHLAPNLPQVTPPIRWRCARCCSICLSNAVKFTRRAGPDQHLGQRSTSDGSAW